MAKKTRAPWGSKTRNGKAVNGNGNGHVQNLQVVKSPSVVPFSKVWDEFHLKDIHSLMAKGAVVVYND